jgi:predicted nucleic acid-binding protein
MKRTFIDSGVLIAAARGRGSTSRTALDILDDPERRFASSVFVRFETVPKAAYHKRDAERTFYEDFFERVSIWALIDSTLIETAFAAACDSGLSAIDSLHIAAAHLIGCDEFITTEKSTTPLHRSSLIKISTIAP